MRFDIALLANVLNGHHGEVVALVGIAHELVDSLGHPGDELSGLLLLITECLGGHVVDTLHLELVLTSIHCFCESVGEEEDSGAWEYLSLLRHVIPCREEADWHIRYTGQPAYTCADEQGSVMASITIV